MKTILVSLLVIVLCLPNGVHAQSIPTIVLESPVDVELQNQGPNGMIPAGTASGFLYTDESSVFFVTAKHVIVDPTSNKLTSDIIVLNSYVQGPDFTTQRHYTLNRTILAQAGDIQVSDSDDVAAIRIGRVQQAQVNKVGAAGPKDSNNAPNLTAVNEPGVFASGDVTTPVFAVHRQQTKIIDQTTLGNPVFTVGYPKSLAPLGQKIDFSKPLLRSGVLAQKNLSMHSLVIDCAAFKGNSGGPVVEIDEISLGTKTFSIIGVVSAFVPLVDNLVSQDYGYHNTTIENSGYTIVVPIDSLLALLGSFKA